MFTLLRNMACVEHGGRTLPAWRCLTLPWAPPFQAWASPSSAAQTLGAFTRAEALPGAWPGQQGLCKARDPSLILLPWWERGVSFSKGCIHRPQRGLWERPGQARAWGCQHREKGLGLNENELPDCNDFIPYLQLSAIQSLSYFYPAEAASNFLQWLFK